MSAQEIDAATLAVQQQYAACPYPPPEAGELPEIRPPAASYGFAHYYCHHRQSTRTRPLILDAGCGTGFSTLKLARANPQAEIVAVDLSAPSLAQAQRRLSLAGIPADQVRWLQADLQTLALEQRFDFIYCTGVLHHLPEPERALTALRAHLQPDGLAAFMLYNPHARREIRAIQMALHALWSEPRQLSEGLMLCRTFFRGLPAEHPFRQRWERDRALVSQELGAIFADSDAFLVDTYLQVCEQDLDLANWWQLFESTDWQIVRFLDEDSWTLARWLPGLPDYYQHLSWRTQMALADPLRRDNNYLFFAAAAGLSVERSPLRLNLTECPLVSPLVESELQADGYLQLHNRLGRKLALAPLAHPLWEGCNGQQSWEQLFARCEAEAAQASPAFRQALAVCAEQISSGYFVWI
jgi:SAM-dependent methyltransferase